MSDFMRTLCKIAIPVTLQGMLQASFSIVDQIMIGQLGEAGIAAVGLCSNFTLIFSVMSGAVGTVAGILIAQFLGAEEHTEAFSYLPMAVSTVLSAWLRCKEHAAVPFWASFGAVAANTGAELSAHLRKAGCPRYGRYRCCHRHAGFPAFEPAFDLDRLCGLPSKGSGTPAHRGDLDTVGGRFMFIFRVQRRA